MTSPTIDAVIFDVGWVLFEWDLRHLFRKIAPHEDEVERIVRDVVTPEWHFGQDEGRGLEEMIAEGIARFPADEHYVRAWATRFNETIPGPVPGSLEIVRDLAAKGIPLFAITNFGHEFWEGFHPTQAIFDLFRDIVVSGTEKLAKPDPAIFRLAIDRFAVTPTRTLFVDDRADNVAAAEALGIQGHVFTDAAGLRGRLERLGVL